MKLQTVHAIFKNGTLIFADSTLVPKDGTEVVVTYLKEPKAEALEGRDPIKALRGRGKGERLVEKLWQVRREDREQDERSCRRLRA
jgi:hypothetical protein